MTGIIIAVAAIPWAFASTMAAMPSFDRRDNVLSDVLLGCGFTQLAAGLCMAAWGIEIPFSAIRGIFL
jgi:hypothetical protein